MNDFIEYKFLKKDNTIIFLFDVKKEQPTSLEWTFALEELKEHIKKITDKDFNFAFIFNVELMGLLSVSKIKEFVALMLDNAAFLEKNLICSAAIAHGSIIKKLFEIVKIFYNTKKPLKIVDTMEESYLFIKECKDTSLNLF